MIAAGHDPIDLRRDERARARTAVAKVLTFREAAERYIQAHRPAWRSPKSLMAWESTLATEVYPHFGDVPVEAVDVGLVLKAIEGIWSTKSETASRIRGRIELVLDWAAARGYREGDNPARWRGHLENLLPKSTKMRRIEHLAALPYSEIAAFLSELRKQTNIAARALEFLILTAARSGEVVGACWQEINLADRVWVVPAARMKGGREHRVPLSVPSVAALETMVAIRSGDHVFPGRRNVGGPMAEQSMRRLLRRMKRAHLTVHGFRSTFRDWAAERTEFPAEVAEMALAHSVGDKVEAAYRRSDLFERRRQIMEAWSCYCDAPPGGNVVPLRTDGR
jgi:integrase